MTYCSTQPCASAWMRWVVRRKCRGHGGRVSLCRPVWNTQAGTADLGSWRASSELGNWPKVSELMTVRSRDCVWTGVVAAMTVPATSSAAEPNRAGVAGVPLARLSREEKLGPA